VAEGRKSGGRHRRWLGGVAGLAGLAAGAVGVTLWLVRGRGAGGGAAGSRGRASADRWARPGMDVTFRAELMPGRSRAERAYRVAELLPNDRVTLEGVAGEHSETEFEALR
jgi:hypothetical protein